MINFVKDIALSAGFYSLVGQLIIHLPTSLVLNFSKIERGAGIHETMRKLKLGHTDDPYNEEALRELDNYLKEVRFISTFRSGAFLYSAYQLYQGQVDPFVLFSAGISIAETSLNLKEMLTPRRGVARLT